MSIFDDKQIDLDLNGPILSFTTNPTGVGSTGVGINSTGGGTVSLTGIATATFPTSADNAGYVTYRWYERVHILTYDLQQFFSDVHFFSSLHLWLRSYA